MLDSPKPPPGQPADPFGLKSYLTAPSTPAHAPTYHETQGLLFAVAAAPQPVPPTEWLALVLGRKQPDLGRVAEPVIDDVFKLYGRQVHRISSQSVRLPRDCRFRDDVMSNFAEDAPMRQWCHGFLNGHVWVGEAWEVPLSEEVAQELGAVLLTLPFFSSREFADESLADMSNCKTLLEAAELTRRLFTDAMGSYAAISQAIRQALADAASRPAVKVGRNEPCPCGSGKKYKRCCFGVKN